MGSDRPAFAARWGALSTVLLCLALVPAPSRDTTHTTTRAGLRFVIAADQKAVTDGLVVQRWQASSHRLVEIPAFVVAGSQAVTITLDGVACRPGDLYVVQSRRLIAPPIEPTTDDCATSVVKVPRTFFKATLQGSVENPPGWAMPRFGTVKVDRCGSRPTAVDTVGGYPITIDPNGRWSTSVPADCILPGFEHPAFAPVRWPAMALSAGQVRNLGTTRLVPAASLSVRIVASSGEPAEGVDLQIIDQSAFEAAVARAVRGDDVHGMADGRTDARGQVRVRGLPEGYVYIWCDRADGEAAFAGPFELTRGAETSAGDVQLSGRGSMLVQAADRTDWLNGEPTMTAWLTPEVASRLVPGAFLRAPVGPSGQVQFADLLAGRWQVALTAEQDNLALAVAEQESRVVAGGQSVVQLDVATNLYHGQVELDGSPLESRLEFDPAPGLEGGSRSRTSTSADGTFFTPLTMPGRYNVIVTSIDGTVDATVAVEATDPTSRLLIDVPSGSIAGLVVGEDRAPVPGATVTARRAPGEQDRGGRLSVATVKSDTDGLFVLRGMGPGRWDVRAGLDALESEPQPVVIGTGASATHLSLLLRRELEVEGQVVSASGLPVVGATGNLSEIGSRPGEVPTGTAISNGPDGTLSGAGGGRRPALPQCHCVSGAPRAHGLSPTGGLAAGARGARRIRVPDRRPGRNVVRGGAGVQPAVARLRWRRHDSVERLLRRRARERMDERHRHDDSRSPAWRRDRGAWFALLRSKLA